MTRRYLVPLVCVVLATGIACSATFALPTSVKHNDAPAAHAAVSSSPAPTAAFKYSPSAPSTGQSVSFDGSASTCSATPCSYTWADDPPTGGSWPLGSGQTMSFTFQNVGTKYVTLTVTDALNRSVNVEHNVVVSAAAAPAAPANTAVPAVSGTAQQGDTLTTSNGSWSGSPTSYAYAWEDCNSSGGSCVRISGETSSSYTLQASDVGSTIRSVVTATMPTDRPRRHQRKRLR